MALLTAFVSEASVDETNCWNSSQFSNFCFFRIIAALMAPNVKSWVPYSEQFVTRLPRWIIYQNSKTVYSASDFAKYASESWRGKTALYLLINSFGSDSLFRVLKTTRNDRDIRSTKKPGVPCLPKGNKSSTTASANSHIRKSGSWKTTTVFNSPLQNKESELNTIHDSLRRIRSFPHYCTVIRACCFRFGVITLTSTPCILLFYFQHLWKRNLKCNWSSL